MNSVPVRKHKRSPKGARQKVLHGLGQFYVTGKEAERVIRAATPLYAVRAAQWARSTFAVVRRKFQGSKFNPDAYDNITFFFLLKIWEHVLLDAKVQTGLSDQEWCKQQDQYLKIYGLRLPANSREASVKILKAARMMLINQL
jgi:hypothetical protein